MLNTQVVVAVGVDTAGLECDTKYTKTEPNSSDNPARLTADRYL